MYFQKHLCCLPIVICFLPDLSPIGDIVKTPVFCTKLARWAGCVWVGYPWQKCYQQWYGKYPVTMEDNVLNRLGNITSLNLITNNLLIHAGTYSKILLMSLTHLTIIAIASCGWCTLYLKRKYCCGSRNRCRCRNPQIRYRFWTNQL